MWKYGLASTGSGSRILVVDDQPVIRALLSDILTGEGYKVETADCGEVAVRRFQEHPFKVVVLDVKMPGMSGFEVLRRLKQADPSVLVVMITGFPTQEKAGEAMKQGAQAVFHKPLNFPSFLPFLHSLDSQVQRNQDSEPLRAATL